MRDHDLDLERQINIPLQQFRSRLQRFWNVVKVVAEKSGIKNLVPFLIIIAYSLLGAVSFVLLEKKFDVQNRIDKRVEIDSARNDTVEKLFLLNKVNRHVLVEIVLSHEETIGFSYPEGETIWDFWNSLFYAGTVYTTIGYGNIACATWQGRFVTILYAIFGIPLSLVVLNHLTKMMFSLIIKITKLLKTCGQKTCFWYKKSKLSHLQMEERIRLLIFDKTGEIVVTPEADFPSSRMKDDVSVNEDDQAPLFGALVATVAWLFLCAGVFCLWENWTYFTSLYFFCISLSTIGFGDIVPEHPKYMCMNFALVLIGLALVSVCFAAIQEKLQNFYLRYLIKLLNEYEKLAEAGESETDASVAMARMFMDNPRAKLMLNLLGKDKKKIVMQEFKEKAAEKQVPIPWAFTDLDKETNMPSVFKAVEDARIDQWTQKLEDYKKRMAALKPQPSPEMQEKETAKKVEKMQKFFVNSSQQTDLSQFLLSEKYLKAQSTDKNEDLSKIDQGQKQRMTLAGAAYNLRENEDITSDQETNELSGVHGTSDVARSVIEKERNKMDNNVNIDKEMAAVAEQRFIDDTKSVSPETQDLLQNRQGIGQAIKALPEELAGDGQPDVSLKNEKRFVDVYQQTTISKIYKKEGVARYPIFSKIRSILEKRTREKRLQSANAFFDSATQTENDKEILQGTSSQVQNATVNELNETFSSAAEITLRPDVDVEFELPVSHEGDTQATLTLNPKKEEIIVNENFAKYQQLFEGQKIDSSISDARKNEELEKLLKEKPNIVKTMLSKANAIQMVDDWSQTVPYLPRSTSLQLTETGTQTRPLPVLKKSESDEIWWYYSWSEIGCQTMEPLTRSRKIQTTSLEAEDLVPKMQQHPPLQKATSFYEKIQETGYEIPENALQRKKSHKVSPETSREPLIMKLKLDNQTQTPMIDTSDKRTQTKVKEMKSVETQYGKSYCLNPFGAETRKIGRLIQQTLSRTNSSLEDQSIGSGTSKQERRKINWTPVPKEEGETQAPKGAEVVLKPGQKVKDLKHLFEH